MHDNSAHAVNTTRNATCTTRANFYRIRYLDMEKLHPLYPRHLDFDEVDTTIEMRAQAHSQSPENYLALQIMARGAFSDYRFLSTRQNSDLVIHIRQVRKQFVARARSPLSLRAGEKKRTRGNQSSQFFRFSRCPRRRSRVLRFVTGRFAARALFTVRNARGATAQ